MKLAIMQPYFFPWLGYFQLIQAVDKFVIYDDVQFIRRGWYNRNRVLLHGSPYTFTVPSKKASQKTLISDIELSSEMYFRWKNKFLKTIATAYSGQEQFCRIMPLVENILDDPPVLISDLNYRCIKKISNYLDINTELVVTSSRYKNSHLKGQFKILDICKQENTSIYINSIVR